MELQGKIQFVIKTVMTNTIAYSRVYWAAARNVHKFTTIIGRKQGSSLQCTDTHNKVVTGPQRLQYVRKPSTSKSKWNEICQSAYFPSFIHCMSYICSCNNFVSGINSYYSSLGRSNPFTLSSSTFYPHSTFHIYSVSHLIFLGHFRPLLIPNFLQFFTDTVNLLLQLNW